MSNKKTEVATSIMAYLPCKKQGALSDTGYNMRQILSSPLCASKGWVLSWFLLSAPGCKASHEWKETALWVETHEEDPRSWILGWILWDFWNQILEWLLFAFLFTLFTFYFSVCAGESVRCAKTRTLTTRNWKEKAFTFSFPCPLEEYSVIRHTTT